MAENGETPNNLGQTFEKIAQSSHNDQKGAKELKILADGASASQYPFDQGPKRASAIQAAMNLVAGLRKSRESSPMEPNKD